jgi:hypothetical protein
MFKPRKVHIFDPDLISSTGHNLKMDASLAHECLGRNIPVTIYGRIGSGLNPDGLDLYEIFRYSIFTEVPNHSLDFIVFRNYFLVNRIFFHELSVLEVDRFSCEDLIYFPNITQNQVEGLTDWIISLPEKYRPTVAVTLRYMGWAMQYNVARGYGPAIEFIYSSVLMKLRERHSRTFYFTDTQVLADNFTRLSGTPVVNLPNPQLGQIKTKQPDASRESALKLLFIGGWGDVHGSCFVPEIVTRIISAFSHVSFTVQVNADSESKLNDLKVMQGLVQQIGSRLTVLEGSLSVAAFEQTMDEADIVLLPYDPANYWFASSGVFSEAAGRGKVLAVTAGTTLASSAQGYNLGAVVIEGFSGESCVQAVSTAIIDFKSLDEKAKLSQLRYASENSAKGFFDTMFDYLGTALK